MKCEAIMKQAVYRATPQDTVEQAARMMRDGDVGFIPVCDQSGKALGTLTDRDIAIRLVAEGKPATTRVGDVATCEVIACRPQDDIEDAKRLMSGRQVSRMLVVDDGGRLQGVISLSDIAREQPGATTETFRDVKEPVARA